MTSNLASLSLSKLVKKKRNKKRSHTFAQCGFTHFKNQVRCSVCLFVFDLVYIFWILHQVSRSRSVAPCLKGSLCHSFSSADALHYDAADFSCRLEQHLRRRLDPHFTGVATAGVTLWLPLTSFSNLMSKCQSNRVKPKCFWCKLKRSCCEKLHPQLFQMSVCCIESYVSVRNWHLALFWMGWLFQCAVQTFI